MKKHLTEWQYLSLKVTLYCIWLSVAKGWLERCGVLILLGWAAYDFFMTKY